jgi:hypothetical protein
VRFVRAAEINYRLRRSRKLFLARGANQPLPAGFELQVAPKYANTADSHYNEWLCDYLLEKANQWKVIQKGFEMDFILHY